MAERRSDQIRTIVELSQEECLELLAAGDVGRLAVALGGAVPIVRPVNYAFDERSRSVVLRIGEGSALQALLQSEKAAFEIDAVDESRQTGWSVIVVGVSEEVTDAAEIERLAKSRPDAWATDEQARWMVIRAWSVSGRRVSAIAPSA